MYPVAIIGNSPAARTAILALEHSGFADVAWHRPTEETSPLSALTLSANLTRVILAVGRKEALLEFAYEPTRQRVRLAKSGYLVSELPLGPFFQERYNAPHLNIEAQHLIEVLEPKLHASTAPLAELEHLLQTYNVVIDQRPSIATAPTTTEPTHILACTSHPRLANTSKAEIESNTTWLSHDGIARQFNTKDNTHYHFAYRRDRPLNPASWHPSLHQAIEIAEPVSTFDPTHNPVRENWHEGNAVFLGSSCLVPNPYVPEASTLGLEDAWVLSRMLENYEEDVGDGLREYERYRRARARRVAAHYTQTAHRYNREGHVRRLANHLNTAISARFLPEIAMQRIDWLYGFDCIKGFR